MANSIAGRAPPRDVQNERKHERVGSRESVSNSAQMLPAIVECLGCDSQIAQPTVTSMPRGRLALGPMSISIVRLGEPRKAGEGLRLGTVRRPPRGVRKSDVSRLNYYDVWFPNLSPSAELVHEALQAADERAWAAFKRKFRREMSQADRSRELDVLAALSHQTNLSLGCYCENENFCHRSVLRELLLERGADVI